MQELTDRELEELEIAGNAAATAAAGIAIYWVTQNWGGIKAGVADAWSDIFKLR